MKRPELIPPDVWDKLTISNAVASGLLGDFPDELERLVKNESRRISEASDDSMIARMLAENMDVESVRKACRIVRMREPVAYNGPRPTHIPMDIWDTMTVREALLYGFLDQPDDYNGLNLDALVCMYPITSRIAKSIRCKLQRIDDVALDGKFRAIRMERAQNAASMRKPRCAKHEVHTVDGNAYCSRCDAMESELLDEPLDIDPSEFDPRNELVDSAKREINIALQMGHSPQELKDALRRFLGGKVEEVVQTQLLARHANQQDIRPNPVHVHTCTNCFENEWCRMDCTIEPDLGTTNDGIPKGSHVRCSACGPEPEEPEPPPFAFREDICRNDGPLLPPFEAGEPTDRVTVMMLYPQIGRGSWASMTRVRCSVAPKQSNSAEFVTSYVEFSINANDPRGHGLRWNTSNNNAAWRDIARTTLRFDLAVRTGEPLAVAAYGLILFALAIGAERERTRVFAAISEADEAMDAVMRTAREVSEGQ